jgi:hypothetical protein
MNLVDFDIRYVNEFETTEEYLGYLEQLYSISPDIFLRYSTELQKHSMRLLSGESQDMNDLEHWQNVYETKLEQIDESVRTGMLTECSDFQLLRVFKNIF